MEKVLQEINNLTRGVAAGIGVIVAVLYFFMFYNDGSAIEGRIQATQAELQTKKNRLNQIKSQIANREKYQEEISQMGAQYRKALNFMPNEFSIAELMRTISNEAKASGTNIIKLEPNKEGVKLNNSDGYEELTVNIELEGTFVELAMFLANISRVRRIVNVTKMAYKVKQGTALPPILGFTSTVAGYRYVEPSVPVNKDPTAQGGTH